MSTFPKFFSNKVVDISLINNVNPDTHSHTSAADADFVFWYESIPFRFNISRKTQITQQVYLYHTNIF